MRSFPVSVLATVTGGGSGGGSIPPGEAARAPGHAAHRSQSGSALTLDTVTEMPLAALGWNDWLALVAAGVSLVSLALAVRADRRAGRAEGRAERAELHDTERAEREREEAETADLARLAIWPNGSTSSVDERRFGYVIRNHGKVTAHNVRVWLYDEDGQDVSIKPQAGFAVKPDESVDNHGVNVAARRRAKGRPLRLSVGGREGLSPAAEFHSARVLAGGARPVVGRDRSARPRRAPRP